MVKKKKIDIAGQLNALNPSIPTRTRTYKAVGQYVPESKGSPASDNNHQIPIGILSLLYENLFVAEKLRKSMVEDSRRFQDLFFKSFTNILNILYESMHTNLKFTSEILQQFQRR